MRPAVLYLPEQPRLCLRTCLAQSRGTGTVITTDTQRGGALATSASRDCQCEMVTGQAARVVTRPNSKRPRERRTKVREKDRR